jgi:hypothetical protein
LTPIEDLGHADELAVEAEQRDGQDRARPETGALIDLAVEALVGVGVGDVQDTAPLRALAGQPGIGRHADGRVGLGRRCRLAGGGGTREAVRHRGEELVALRVVLEHRRPLGVQRVAHGVEDHGEDLGEVRRRAQSPCHVEHALQRLSIELVAALDRDQGLRFDR